MTAWHGVLSAIHNFVQMPGLVLMQNNIMLLNDSVLWHDSFYYMHNSWQLTAKVG